MNSTPLGKVLEAASQVLALAGGAVLAAVAGVSTVSIATRWLFSRPLVGDLEIVQIGCTIAVALFLPWCQAHSGHIIVDFFTSRARHATRLRLDAAGATALALIFLLLTWRVAVGVADMKANGETSMLLAFPTWITYLLLVPGLALSGLIGLHGAWRLWARARQP
jgi:TRAP-type C4-dicarboxylate transport system permease small subunit